MEPVGTDDEQGKKRSRGAVTVVETLKEDILTLRISPGSALDEVAIAQRFGLSRTPIREALLVLSGEGLVTFLENRTTIVTPHSMHNASDYLDTLILLSRAVFRHAAERRGDDDIAATAAALDELARAVKTQNVDEMEPAELRLKKVICDSAQNFFFSKYYPSCLDFGRRMLRLHYYPVVSGTELARNIQHYQSLLSAIRDRDAGECDRIAMNIINDTVSVLQRSLLPSETSTIEIDKADITRLKMP